MHIETVTAETLEEYLPLLADYQRFYETPPDNERNRRHFAQFTADHAQGILFLARGDDRRAIGMATLYFPHSSVQARQQCLMNDLYVVPQVRGQGVGRALIEHCRQYAARGGYDALVWITATTNHTAQRLYNSLPTTHTAWLRYRLPTV